MEDEADPAQVWLLNQTSNPFQANRDIADHAGAMTLINIVRLVAGRDWYPRRLRLQTNPTSTYRKIPGLLDCEVLFASPATGVAFPADWLLNRIDAPPQPSPSDAMESGLLNPNEPLEEKLRRMLKSLYGIRCMVPTLHMMAEFCDTSPRTLQRRIQESRTSYKELLREVRTEGAKTLLRESDLSVHEIAFEFGYSGSNNFIRAFKKNTGVTPTVYRRQAAGHS
jgi:AraC-like DNA-binding protein